MQSNTHLPHNGRQKAGASSCFIGHLLPFVTVYGAKQMPIETKKEMHSELVDEQRNSCMQALQEKRKHIDNAKNYVGP